MHACIQNNCNFTKLTNLISKDCLQFRAVINYTTTAKLNLKFISDEDKRGREKQSQRCEIESASTNDVDVLVVLNTHTYKMINAKFRVKFDDGPSFETKCLRKTFIIRFNIMP